MSIRAGKNGFTILELLVVIAIVITLAAFLFTAFGRVSLGKERVGCLHNLHQTGVGILSYTTDHNGTYPGPVYVGQGIYYQANQLPYLIAPYLGLAPGSTTERVPSTFVCPAWLRTVRTPKASDPSACYIVNHRIYLSGTNHQPFGYPANSGSGVAEVPPMTQAQVSALEGLPYTQPDPPDLVFRLSTTWILQDLDQRTSGVSGSGWGPFLLPAKPVHGTSRNCLFFDFHAEAVPAAP